jgi:hypothetical protein
MKDDTGADDKPAETAHEKLLKKARQCYALGVDAIKPQVEREKDDLRCQVPELIWPDAVKSYRAGETVGGMTIPPRPTISIPSLAQPVQLVLNQEKAAHLGVQIHALSEDADEDTAEILQGLYRRIEVDSRAGLARSWAYERAVKAGRGAYRVLTEYADDGGHFTDQKIVIKRILHQEAVVFDPFAQEPDWSDGRWAFVTQWVPYSRYKQDYPKSELSKYGQSSDDPEGFFDQMPEDERPHWIQGDGESRAVLVAEFFYLEFTEKTRVQYDDDSDGYDDAVPAGRKVKKDGRSRKEQVPKLKWCKLNGGEVLDEEERDGRYIPIIPVIGQELQPFDDDRYWVGIYGPNKEAARMLNVAASNAIEIASMETKAPYLIAEGQEEGHEKEFLLAAVRQLPYVRYKPTALNGQPVPPPQRTQIDTSRLGPSMMLLGMAREFIQSGTGAFRETLGQADPSNKTKGGIMALQDQHTRGNSHFLDNLAQISITYEAKVVLDLIPYVYDRPGRVARTLDLEDNAKTVILNQPFVPGPNKRPQPLQEGPQTDARVQDPNDPAKRYDLKKGTYGVAVSVGKARESRIEEGSDGLSMLFQANPALFQLFGDLWLKFQTWPGHMEAAERAKKMLPPQLHQEDDQQAKQAQELGQLKQAAQVMQQQLQQAGEIIKTKQIEQQAKIQAEQIGAQKDVTIAQHRDATTLQKTQMDNETRLAVAELGAKIERMTLFLEERARLGTQAHEVGMAAMGQQHALEAGQQGAAMDAQAADQGQAHALEQQQQAAALAPPPVSGNGSGA